MILVIIASNTIHNKTPQFSPRERLPILGKEAIVAELGNTSCIASLV